MKKTIVSIFLLGFTCAIYSQDSLDKILKIKAGNIFLEGSLLAPQNAKKLVIIIAGSGPTDRNGNSSLGVKGNSYKLLAQHLYQNNIASFRYDKRAIGESAYSNVDENNLLFDDYINDVVTLFNYFKDSSSYKNIFYAGHSEGSAIGMIAAEKTSIKGFISISGVAQSIDEILKTQLSFYPDSIKNKISEILASLKKEQLVPNAPSYLYSLFRPSVQPYMISWLKYKPAEEIKKLNCPILILQGTCDKQVKEEEANALHAANPKSELVIIPLMTHALKNTSADCKDFGSRTYVDPIQPLNELLTKSIVNFINKN